MKTRHSDSCFFLPIVAEVAVALYIFCPPVSGDRATVSRYEASHQKDIDDLGVAGNYSVWIFNKSKASNKFVSWFVATGWIHAC